MEAEDIALSLHFCLHTWQAVQKGTTLFFLPNCLLRKHPQSPLNGICDTGCVSQAECAP